MSIHILCGPPRQGKSYHAVNHYANEAIKSGRKVLTNLPLNLEVLNEEHGEDVVKELVEFREFTKDPDTWQDEWKNEAGVGTYVIADESADFLKGDIPEELAHYFRMHGHMSQDILFITQIETDITPAVRKMSPYVDEVQNLDKLLGDMGKYRVHTYRMVQGQRKKLQESRTFSFSKTGFERYKSRTQSDQSGKNAKVLGTRPLWKQPKLLALVFVLVACVGTLVSLNPFAIYKNIFTADTPDIKTSTVAPSKSSVSAPQASKATRTSPVIIGASQKKIYLNDGFQTFSVDMPLGVSLHPTRCGVIINRKPLLCGNPYIFERGASDFRRNSPTAEPAKTEDPISE
jgi:zona occludens toxin